jgi:galactitol-specific phosphotransferase system IIC component
MSLVATSRLAIFGSQKLCATIFGKGIGIMAGFDNNTTALAAVATIGATLGITSSAMKAY